MLATASPRLMLFICCFSFVTIPHVAVSTLAQSDNYIIHMDSSAMPRAFSSQHSWYRAILTTFHNPQVIPSSSSLSSKLIYSYNHVINGFSATLSPNELEALKTTPGYVSAIRDLPVKLDTTHSTHFLGLNPNFGAWPAAEFGEDVIIGLVDTGIWPESESFKDDGLSEIPLRWKGRCESGTQFSSSLCNKKLIGAKFFNRGFVVKNPNITITMNSSRDTDGHGTHTSSTAAGSFVDGASYFGYAAGTASGVAPKARIAMYKVFWPGSDLYSSDIIAAIDSAISDGVDVLSLSFGRNVAALYEDPVAIATFAAAEKGIFVSTSAGNAGPQLANLHNGTPWVITVAAGTMDREFGGTLKLGNGVSVTGRSLYPGNFSASQNIPIVYMGRCDKTKDLIKVRNKIVVCDGKDKTLGYQVDNLDMAKVTAGVFISNSTEVRFFLQTKFPSIFLNPKDGEVVRDYVKKISAPKARMAFKMTILGSRPAPSVDSYSSRGPSPSCPLVSKPDVLAPGTLVLAAWPPILPVMEMKTHNLFSSFNLLSGTSMACPHVAGVAALLKGAHPDWSPAAIRSAIMTTSDAFDNTGGFITDIADNYKEASPLAIGAGHVNPNKALNPGLVYDAGIEDYVNLLCALNYSKKNISIITRSAKNNCANKSVDLNYPSFIAFFDGNESFSSPTSRTVVKEFHRTVTNVGEGESLYRAVVTPIRGFEVSVIPDKLLFRQKNEKQSYKLRIEGPRRMKKKVAFGHLAWVDPRYMVHSRIVLTSLNPQSVSSQN